MAETIYVFGAGFTKAFLPTAPLRVDDFDGEALEAKYAEFPTALDLVRLERRRNDNGLIDIERLMSRLDGGMPFDLGGAAEEVRLLLADLKRGFVARIEAARKGAVLPDLLIQFARHCIETETGIVTFNHDDFLDEALWRVKSVTSRGGAAGPYWHPDGGYGFFCRPSVSRVVDSNAFMDQSTPLLKLHGSMNWRPILGARWPYAADEIVHQEEWLPTSPQFGHLNLEAIESLLEPEPFIVPPLLLKSALTEQPILRLVWSQAAKAMREARSVTFVGYSMPTTDIAAAFLFRETLHRVPLDRVKIVDYGDGPAHREQLISSYRQVFPKIGATLSANMSETVTRWEFRVEGEAGSESDERIGADRRWAGDRGGGEGDAAAVHGGVQAEDRPRGRRV